MPVIVMQQGPAAITAHVDIIESVVIVVADGAPYEVAGDPGEAGLAGYILEMPVTVSAKKRQMGPYEENIEIAVVVIVEKGTARANALQRVYRPGAGDGSSVAQAGLVGDIHEMCCLRAG
jgi:hypothetical protein